MITEIARITIDPVRADDFEAAVARCVDLFLAAPGCRSMRLDREVEDRSRYRLVVGWESLAAHVVDFRGSDAFARWRAAAGPFFLSPPEVVHSETVIGGDGSAARSR